MARKRPEWNGFGNFPLAFVATVLKWECVCVCVCTQHTLFAHLVVCCWLFLPFDGIFVSFLFALCDFYRLFFWQMVDMYTRKFMIYSTRQICFEKEMGEFELSNVSQLYRFTSRIPWNLTGVISIASEIPLFNAFFEEFLDMVKKEQFIFIWVHFLVVLCYRWFRSLQFDYFFFV